MAKLFADYKDKDSVVIVYTGEGKGKTSASLGLVARALGNGWSVAYIQFIKMWDVSEHKFMRDIQKIYKDRLYLYVGGKGFFNAGELSAKDVTEGEHRQAALATYEEAVKAVAKYDLVVCDEINNAVNDGLLKVEDMKNLITKRAKKTNLCLTGRDFPEEVLELADIATNMTKLKHHFDDKYLAKEGIDY